ncbi:MAG: long-chain-fatty-acid--CoA ligase [Comamonadaceae bacterium]|nr:MAG: long-chain-fatty-acid--CoA ligase [Comamonadaceae bacterium]
MSGLRITDWFEYTAVARPDLPFISMRGRTFTYAQADALANQWANALIARGLQVGDRLAVLSTNSLEMCILLMAAAKAGIAPVMLNYRLAPVEWAAILKDSEPRLLFVRGDEYAQAIDGLALPALVPGLELVAIEGGAPPQARCEWLTLDAFAAGRPVSRPARQVDAGDMLYLIYTSGTTGLPKGVMISHANVLAHVEQSMTATSAGKAPGERALVTTPLYHAAGIHRIVNAAVTSGTVVLMEHFDGPEFVDTLERERINTCNMVPAIMQSLLEGIPDIASRDFSQLKVIYYGAAPVSVPLLKRALQVFRCDLIQGYGLTESSGGFVYLNEVDHARALAGHEHLLGSTGRPVLAQVRIVDEDGNDVPAGEPGELLVRGPNVMMGYWRNPEATSQALRNGWLHSGDVASMDAEGYIYLRDRLKDMIVTGGTNVYPREVENVLLAHAAIADVAVIGVPDEKWGESLLAVCVARDGQRPTDESLIAFCRERLGGFKIPRQYTFVDALPRNASGKVLKRSLREPYWAGAARAIA